MDINKYIFFFFFLNVYSEKDVKKSTTVNAEIVEKKSKHISFNIYIFLDKSYIMLCINISTKLQNILNIQQHKDNNVLSKQNIVTIKYN